MKIGKRVDILTNKILDLRFLAETLKGRYDNIYITFTTIEDQADAWKDAGDFFLHIPLSPTSVINGENLDFRKKIIEHLPMLEDIDYQELISYVEEKLQADFAQD